ncbi:MAG: DEAD/DEAH box helicase family protein, partial [Longicatena sp.]
MPELISDTCSYFDSLKNESLSDADLKFLRHIAIEVGIPHYYDMLNNFQNVRDRRLDINLKTLQDMIKESVLHTSEDSIIHKYQNEVLSKFKDDNLNRFFLSASTSFGKTFLVYEIIRKMKYNNIVLIFPTIALLSENLKKIHTEEIYSWIKESYKIHTLSDVEMLTERNIFIYTPERFLSFMDKKINLAFDFLFVDEAYKIDNEYIIDDESQENERDVAYRLAIFFGLVQPTTDALLAGPYIDFFDSTKSNYNPSFDYFLRDNNIELLDYNHIEIVNKRSVDIKSKRRYEIDTNYAIDFNDSSKPERFKTIVCEIRQKNENSIVYCHSRTEAEKYAKHIVHDNTFQEINYSAFADFISHIETEFGNSNASDWIVVKALKKGVGIHHGLIPKYIQKEIIRLFNNGYIHILLSTTTLTEG